MLYHLLYPLHTTYSFFNVFRYITFRTIYAIVTALVISFLIGEWSPNYSDGIKSASRSGATGRNRT
ncbi:MAG: hypothetical protein MPW14_16910 [Candidatus Manganitrophus sp.]|nr:MAG: hypothetical protein MPW14_16910 [Candidatus Manganitrophus sp.]